MRGRRGAATFLVAAACTLGACSGASPAPAIAPSTSAPTTAAPAPTTTAVALIPQSSPDIAATTLLQAWGAGDRVLAAKVATPPVVAAVFGRPAEGFSDRGCQDPVGGQSSCAFAVGGGLVSVHTVGLAGGWVVDRIVFE